MIYTTTTSWIFSSFSQTTPGTVLYCCTDTQVCSTQLNSERHASLSRVRRQLSELIIVSLIISQQFDLFIIFPWESKSRHLVLLVIPLVHEWNIAILPEFNKLKLVFHEAPAEWNTSFNELNEGNKAIFHEWTKGITSEHHSFLLSPNFKTKKLYFASKLKQIGKDLA